MELLEQSLVKFLKKNVKNNGGLPGESPGRTSEGNFAGVFFLAPGGIPRGIPS